MRTILPLLILSTSLGLSGCSALDEIDKASAKLPAKGKKSAEQVQPASGAAGAEAKANPLLEKSKRWWDEATSLSPAEKKTSIVQCRLPGQTQFMDRDDCLARGGVVSG